MNQLVDREAELIEQIRVNVAFEQMVVAVLGGAFVGGALTLFLKLGAMILNGFAIGSLVTVMLDTLTASFLIFLVGFFSSIAIGTPLFMKMENNKRRNAWPYGVAALGVAIASFVFVTGGLPVAGDININAIISIFVPALVFSFLFARLMTPHWRAAQKADAEAATKPKSTNIVRLH